MAFNGFAEGPNGSFEALWRTLADSAFVASQLPTVVKFPFVYDCPTIPYSRPPILDTAKLMRIPDDRFSELYEDRLSMHRQKADEAYVIGKRGQFTPVGAYLAGDEIIRIAVEHGVQMIHPGYGFLSENAEFARNVEKAGLI
ncbi:hypothetical protein FZEAL_9949, partial [Fusarium zealandicum]